MHLKRDSMSLKNSVACSLLHADQYFRQNSTISSHDNILGVPSQIPPKSGKLGPKAAIIQINSLTRARRSKVRIRRTRVEHDKTISRVQNIVKEVGIRPNAVFIAENTRKLGNFRSSGNQKKKQ